MSAATQVHGLLEAFTSSPKLTSFVKSHLDPNYTVATVGTAGLPVDAPVVSMKNVSGGKVVIHKLRKRLKTEFGTVRPVSAVSARVLCVVARLVVVARAQACKCGKTALCVRQSARYTRRQLT